MRPLALLLAALVAGGCADAVDPTLGTDQVYSLYGYLDPTADRQAIRVVPIAPTLDADTTAAGAVVTSREPATGRTAAWRDTLVTFDDGSTGTVFLADYTPTAGTAVEIDVAAPDGRVARVAVEVPPLAVPTVGDTGDPGQPAQVYPVEVAGVPRVLGGSLRVLVKALPGADPDRIDTLEVPLERLAIRSEGSTWTAEVPFLAATRALLQVEGLANRGVRLVAAEFMPFVANEAWAVPPGGFDPDQIVEPGAFSNVEGGFGFVGAGYWAPVQWLPSTNIQSLAGFTVTNDPAAFVAINEVGAGYVELYNPTTETIGLGSYVVSTTGTVAGGVQIEAGREIRPGGYLIVDGPFAASASVSVQFLTGSGRLLQTMFVEVDVAAWGAYPDGFSHKLPRGGPDLFAGPVVPSGGGPNRPASVPEVLNEVAASGSGFVEVVSVTGSDVTGVVGSSGQALERGGVDLQGGAFATASESGLLELDQLGGWVFLLIGTQVVDARQFEPQSPGRSAGYLPDGRDGAWTEGLRPTRGAPNAAARLGL